MGEMTLSEGLKLCFKNAIKNNDKLIVVFVEFEEGKKSEIIINERMNFDYKLEYYLKTYDENLIHKHCKDIKIVDFMSVKSFTDLAKRKEGWKNNSIEMDLKINGMNMLKDDLESVEQRLDRIINKYDYINEKVTNYRGEV